MRTRSSLRLLLLAGACVLLAAAVPFAAAARPAAAATAASFAFPAGYPDGGGYNTTAGYGFLQVGAQGIHPGEDWNKNCAGDCELNAPVQAAANGRVVAAGFYPVWGNIILIEHTLPGGTI